MTKEELIERLAEELAIVEDDDYPFESHADIVIEHFLPIFIEFIKGFPISGEKEDLNFHYLMGADKMQTAIIEELEKD